MSSTRRSRGALDARQVTPYLLAVVSAVGTLFLVPFVGSAWALVWLVGTGFFGYSHFAVVHEAIHGNLHGAPRINKRLGRFASVLFGSPYEFLKNAHLLHHKYNRTLGRPDLYEPALENPLRANARYYFDLCAGLYLKEFGMAVVALLPRRWWALPALSKSPDSLEARLFGGIARDQVIWSVRWDSVAILAIHAASFACYARAGMIWAFVAFFFLRAFVVSVLDNVYHFRTEVNDVFFARNLRLPGALEFMLMNFNYHGVHHLGPGIPWYRLRAEFVAHGGQYHGEFSSMVVWQFSGPEPLPAPTAVQLS